MLSTGFSGRALPLPQGCHSRHRFAKQAVRTEAGDRDGNELPHPIPPPAEVHDTVVRASPRELRGILATLPLDQHLYSLAHPPRMFLELDLFLEIQEPRKSFALDGLGDIVRLLSRGERIGSLRVLEGVDAVEAMVVHQREGLAELRLGFARKSDDEVGRDRKVWNVLPRARDLALVFLPRVAALHAAENRRRPRLRREVHVGTEPSKVAESPHQGLPEVLGMRARETDSPQVLDLVDRIEEPLDPAPVPRVAVRVHVLAEKLHLSETPLAERSSFPNDVGDRAASLPPSGERHDAKRAEVVAALHDRDVGLDARHSLDLFRRDVEVLGMPADLADPLLRSDHGREYLGKLHQALRSEDEVHLGGPFQDGFTLLLGDTARNPHDHRALPLQVREAQKTSEDPLLGLFADAAGIQDQDVGLVLGRRPLEAEPLQASADLLSFFSVHLAAPGLDPVAAIASKIRHNF